jgi:hypothetical protein
MGFKMSWSVSKIKGDSTLFNPNEDEIKLDGNTKTNESRYSK